MSLFVLTLVTCFFLGPLMSKIAEEFVRSSDKFPVGLTVFTFLGILLSQCEII